MAIDAIKVHFSGECCEPTGKKKMRDRPQYMNTLPLHN